MEIGDTSDALLARVAWLPDSTQVAVERMNRVQNEWICGFAMLRAAHRAWRCMSNRRRGSTSRTIFFY